MGKVNTWGTIFPRRTRFSNGPEEISNAAEQKSTYLTDGDGRVSEEEKLVDAGNEDGPNETDDPSAEGRRWHRGIIRVGNRRTDFWIWGFVLKGKGRWVKVWVVKFVDSNALFMLRVFR
jgi:hypothetical protein